MSLEHAPKETGGEDRTDEEALPAAWSPIAWRKEVGNMGPMKFYGEVAAGRIEIKKAGRKSLVTTPPKKYVDGLPTKAEAEVAA